MNKQETVRRDSSSGRFVQVKNPVTGRWVKVSTKTGAVVDMKKSAGPYKGVAIKRSAKN